MSFLLAFSSYRFIARRDTEIAAVFTWVGFRILFQEISPCCEKLLLNEPKPGSNVPTPPGGISPGIKPVSELTEYRAERLSPCARSWSIRTVPWLLTINSLRESM